jgi:hypothetical protein
MFTLLSEEEFRLDVSSTEIRKQMQTWSNFLDLDYSDSISEVYWVLDSQDLSTTPAYLFALYDVYP